MLPYIIIFLALGALLVIGALQKRNRPVKAISANLLITYTMIALILIGAELFFRFVYAETDGLPTLASRNWLDRYYHLNTLGYRDREWTQAEWEGKTTILAVGDSFTAGWGIPDPADRYTDQLAARLGEDYAVINIGEAGTTTVSQLENLREYPLQNPDIVLWQYYLNDIDDAALSIGLDPGLNPMANMPAWAADSYFGNFLYWRFASPQTRGSDTYINWLFSMYDNSTVWDIHAGEINAMIDHIESSGADMIVLIFPDMLQPFNSIPYVDRVADVFEARGFGGQVIKLFDAAESMPLNARVASPRDAHPSADFSTVVADLIYAGFFSR